MIGVYGAGGFIGRHLTKRLAREGRNVRAVLRHTDNGLLDLGKGNVDIINADLMDPLAMASSLDGINTVVQLISSSSPGLGNHYMIADVTSNIIPHVEFMNSCIAAGVKRYIFVSSGGTVYGPTRICPIPEDHPTNPISSHGLTKLTTEKYLQMQGYVSGLDYVILRVANAYGPGQTYRKGQGLIPSVIEHHGRDEAIQIIGNGLARRDYVFVDDVVDACVAAIDVSGPQQQVFNIGSGESRSVLEVLDSMETILGVAFRREFVEKRRTDVDISQLDIAKARRILDWHPRTAFIEGLTRMLSGIHF